MMLSSQAQMGGPNPRAMMKGVFIYNFTKYTEWPEEYKQGEFVIGVVNDDDLAEILEKNAQSKKINSQNVVVKRFNSTSDITKCHLLYVGGSTVSDVSPFVTKAKQYSCLIVTEGTGLVENSAAINFVVVGSRIQFEMNKGLFDDQQLIVSNSLEKLATRVIN